MLVSAGETLSVIVGGGGGGSSGEAGGVGGFNGGQTGNCRSVNNNCFEVTFLAVQKNIVLIVACPLVSPQIIRPSSSRVGDALSMGRWN